MHTFVICLFAALAVANAGLIAGPATTVLQGPSAGATLVGPDGSVIVGAAPGGTVVARSAPGVVATTGPILAGGVLAHGGLLGNTLVGPAGIISTSHGLGLW